MHATQYMYNGSFNRDCRRRSMLACTRRNICLRFFLMAKSVGACLHARDAMYVLRFFLMAKSVCVQFHGHLRLSITIR